MTLVQKSHALQVRLQKTSCYLWKMFAYGAIMASEAEGACSGLYLREVITSLLGMVGDGTWEETAKFSNEEAELYECEQ